MKVLPPGAPADAQLKLGAEGVPAGFRRPQVERVGRLRGPAAEKRAPCSASRPSTAAPSGSCSMRKADAEKVVGELVSDTINQMDLAALFKQAGL
ncbi:MAG: hypothetical protein MZV70_67260 [Desulfobacterales bacterium]|nr:hypothetical protein [Desulfobacterales bacterium]